MIKKIYELLKEYNKDFKIQIDWDWVWYHDVLIITVFHQANKYRFAFTPDVYKQSNIDVDELFLKRLKEALDNVVNGKDCW